MSNLSSASGEVEMASTGRRAEVEEEAGTVGEGVVADEDMQAGMDDDSEGKNGKEAEEGRRLEKASELGESDRREESVESDSYGASSKSTSFVFANPQNPINFERSSPVAGSVEKRGRRSSCQCEPSTSTTPPKCHDDEEMSEEREDSLMSSRFFDDTDIDWEKLPPKSANEDLRKAMRRQSLCYNLPHMTEEETFKFFKPSDFFDLPDQYSTDSSTTTNESEASYWRRFEEHQVRKERKKRFMALSKEEKRLACEARAKRVLNKREYRMVSKMPYEDLDFIRKPPKRRRVGEEEKAEDDWDVEDRLMRKRNTTWRKFRGIELENIEPAVKRLNPFVEFVVVPVEEEEDQVVEAVIEQNEVAEVEVEQVAAVEMEQVAVVGVEQGMAVVGAVQDNAAEADAAAEELDESDDEEPMDQGIGSDDDMSSVSSTATAIPLRRSQRVRKPIDRWAYPVDHIPTRRRYARRNALVQLARPIRRRPMMLPRPVPAPVVKQPRQPPFACRAVPPLPAPTPVTPLVSAQKEVLFDDIGVELDECRAKASAADYGFEALEITCKISKIATTCTNFRKVNSTPSPLQMKRILTALAKVRSMLGMV